MKKEQLRGYILLMIVAGIVIFGVQNIHSFFTFISMLLSTLTPVFLGIAIAFILYTPYSKVQNFLKKGIKGKVAHAIPAFSILIVYIGAIAIIAGIVAFIIPQLASSVKMLYENLENYSKTIEAFSKTMVDNLHLYNVDLTFLQDIINDIPKILNGIVSVMFPALFDITSNIVKLAVNFIVALVIGAYILTDKENLQEYFTKIILAYLPRKIADRTFYIGRVSYSTFTKFLAGQLTEALILGSLCFVGMLIFGFAYPLLISVLIGITSLVPIAGAFIGAVPAVFLLLMVNPPKALWFIVFILLLQQLEGDFIYPRVVGSSIGLPALWVLVAILIGGGVGGILGMLISVPTLSVLYQLLNEDVEKRLGK